MRAPRRAWLLPGGPIPGLLLPLLALVLLSLSPTNIVQGGPRPRAAHGEESDTSNSHEENEEHGRGGHHHFGYERPEDWASRYPVCAGPRQSPINIELQDVATMDPARPPLCRDGFDAKPKRMSIANNGHSVQLTGEWPERDTPTIYGGPLTGIYQLAQIHFHWGANNDVGSEHTVANHSFPLEMHMVHWKQAYGNLTEAIQHDDGIAVLGYFMSLDKNANMGLERMRVSFPSILKPGQNIEVEPFPLSLFDLDLIKEGYVTYPGSLTTPPCSESVTWLLSVRIKDVTIDELESFRRLRLNNHDDHNYRPTQPLNERSILYLFETLA